MKKLALAALVTLGLAASPAFAKQSGVKIGVLNCDVSAGVGMILASSKTVKCKFDRAVGGTEYYKGTIEKLGIDIGFTGKGVISWIVFAPGQISKGALQGRYAGASAEATVAVGLGANVRPGPDRPERGCRCRRAAPQGRQEVILRDDVPKRPGGNAGSFRVWEFACRES